MKTGRKFIALLLAVLLAFSCAFSVGAAEAGEGSAAVTETATEKSGVSAQHIICTVLENIFKALFAVCATIVPDSDKFIDREDYDSAGFVEGNETFLTEPAEDAVWRMGSASVSLVPDDWQEKDYYLGGYIMIENGFSNRVETIVDDMQARVIAMDDGTGRGTAVFATLDCIGMTNADIRKIREKLVEKAGSKYDFSGITVCSTHTHSGIDTEGLWTNLIGKVLKNLPKAQLGIGELESGTDPEYMALVYDRVSSAMLAACDNMHEGTMTYATKKINKDYFTNKNRSSASSLLTDMTRLVFTPYDETVRPIMVVSIAAHPDVAGLPTSDGQSNGRELCGEYIYYMGDIINKAGYDFMFFNGAIAGIYMGRGLSNDNQTMEHRYQQSQRYGWEIGRIALSMTKTVEEIEADPLLSLTEEERTAEIADATKNGGGYTLWYKDWTPVEERELAPLFNIRFKEVYIPVTNRFIECAGKLNLANYTVQRDEDGYWIATEIGYMQLDDLGIALMPGEVCQDLVAGGTSLEAATSYSGTDFEGKTIAEIFGDGTVVFGLANDAIGYVIPDNDYCMCIVYDHYQELISLGKYTASSLMKGFEELKAEISK